MTLKEYIETYKSELPEDVKEALKFFENKNPKPDFEPITDEEAKRVQEIMKMPDEEFDSMELGRKWGCIMVSRPGIVWAVNLEKCEKIVWCIS